MATPLSARLWKPYEERFSATLLTEIPFLFQLHEHATLRMEDPAFLSNFKEYKRHDCVYLRSFTACLAALLRDIPQYLTEDVLCLVQSAQQEYAEVLKTNCTQDDGPLFSPSFIKYIDFLTKEASRVMSGERRDRGFILAVCLSPCFRFYAYIGKALAQMSPLPDENQCQQWITMYASDKFHQHADKMDFIVDELSKHAGIESEAEHVYARAMDYEIGIFLEFGAQKTINNGVTNRMPYPQVLAIGGSDSGGGAGIQADIKACEAFRVFSCTAITAITAQNTLGVQSIVALEGGIVRSQISSCLDDYTNLRVIKTGMVPNSDTVDTICDALGDTKRLLVVDPVIMSGSGDMLMDGGTLEQLKSRLLPLALLVTPNRPEAAALLGIPEQDVYAQRDQNALEFLKTFRCQAVLFKGGHDESPLVMDTLYARVEESFDGENFTRAHVTACVVSTHPRILKLSITHRRITGENQVGHGSGCTLASSIAAGLARGCPQQALSVRLCESVVAAVDYVHEAMEAAQMVHIGEGNGPLLHHYR